MAWGILEPLLQGWRQDQAMPLPAYEAGSWGPAEADAFIRRDGFSWRNP
jgi:glucose-6-phosphate 1-dehydrogenase